MFKILIFNTIVKNYCVKVKKILDINTKRSGYENIRL